MPSSTTTPKRIRSRPAPPLARRRKATTPSADLRATRLQRREITCSRSTGSGKRGPSRSPGGQTMDAMRYDKDFTALLVIDPYNDFISEGGKLWDRLRGVAEANHCIPHMMAVLSAARNAQLRVFYALHRRYRPGDYETWKYIAPVQKAAWSRKTFEHAKLRVQIGRAHV